MHVSVQTMIVTETLGESGWFLTTKVRHYLPGMKVTMAAIVCRVVYVDPSMIIL